MNWPGEEIETGPAALVRREQPRPPLRRPAPAPSNAPAFMAPPRALREPLNTRNLREDPRRLADIVRGVSNAAPRVAEELGAGLSDLAVDSMWGGYFDPQQGIEQAKELTGLPSLARGAGTAVGAFQRVQQGHGFTPEDVPELAGGALNLGMGLAPYVSAGMFGRAGRGAAMRNTALEAPATVDDWDPTPYYHGLNDPVSGASEHSEAALNLSDPSGGFMRGGIYVTPSTYVANIYTKSSFGGQPIYFGHGRSMPGSVVLPLQTRGRYTSQARFERPTWLGGFGRRYGDDHENMAAAIKRAQAAGFDGYDGQVRGGFPNALANIPGLNRLHMGHFGLLPERFVFDSRNVRSRFAAPPEGQPAAMRNVTPEWERLYHGTNEEPFDTFNTYGVHATTDYNEALRYARLRAQERGGLPRVVDLDARNAQRVSRDMPASHRWIPPGDNIRIQPPFFRGNASPAPETPRAAPEAQAFTPSRDPQHPLADETISTPSPLTERVFRGIRGRYDGTFRGTHEWWTANQDEADAFARNYNSPLPEHAPTVLSGEMHGTNPLITEAGGAGWASIPIDGIPQGPARAAIEKYVSQYPPQYRRTIEADILADEARKAGHDVLRVNNIIEAGVRGPTTHFAALSPTARRVDGQPLPMDAASRMGRSGESDLLASVAPIAAGAGLGALAAGQDANADDGSGAGVPAWALGLGGGALAGLAGLAGFGAYRGLRGLRGRGGQVMREPIPPRAETPTPPITPDAPYDSAVSRARLRAFGFNTDEPFYHGTQRDVQGALRPSGSGARGPGAYIGSRPETTEGYAGTPSADGVPHTTSTGRNLKMDYTRMPYGDAGGNIMPLYARGPMANMDEWRTALRAAQRELRAPDQTTSDVQRRAQEMLQAKGYTGLRDTEADYNVMFPDPDGEVRNLRSIFARGEDGSSSDLLAGIAPFAGGAGLGALAAPQDASADTGGDSGGVPPWLLGAAGGAAAGALGYGAWRGTRNLRMRGAYDTAPGESIPAFHGTLTEPEISTFHPLSHFGTRRAAEGRLRAIADPGDDRAVLPARIAPGRRLVMQDNGLQHDDRNMIRSLVSGNALTRSERDYVLEPYRSAMQTLPDGFGLHFEGMDPSEEAYRRVGELLSRKGYSRIEYQNLVEDPGSISYIVPDPVNVQRARRHRGLFGSRYTFDEPPPSGGETHRPTRYDYWEGAMFGKPLRPSNSSER